MPQYTFLKGVDMSKRIKQQPKQDTGNEPLEPLLSIADLMKLLNVSRPTVYTLIDEGLPFIRFGRARRFSPVSLRRFLTQREETA
jgi:excisionase family DNA binding protein